MTAMASRQPISPSSQPRIGQKMVEETPVNSINMPIDRRAAAPSRSTAAA